MRSGRLKVLAVAALFLLAMAACSDDPEPGDGTSSPTESSAPSEEPAEATVAVEDSDLGQIVVDAEGRTRWRVTPWPARVSTARSGRRSVRTVLSR